MRRAGAHILFGLLMVGAPLAFGLVDRAWQVAALCLLGLGSLCAAPSFKAGPRWLATGVLVLVLLCAKEFLPYPLLGQTHWRSVLTNDFLVSFLPPQNPEPSRAVDAILALIAGGIWFLWVRTLAQHNQLFVAWIVFSAATILAIVCLVTMHANPEAGIYGLRQAVGWRGFGPFPNRNHTACFLAMGFLVGCGCFISALRRSYYWLSLFGTGALVTILWALFFSQSRGGGLALGLGLCMYVAVLLWRHRNLKMATIALSGVLIVCAVFLLSGRGLLERLASFKESGASNKVRMEVWQETLTMWRDAPLFGHGLETFPRIFPLYQELELDNTAVLHPESSWLLWLVELGILPLTLFVGVGLCFVMGAIKDNPLSGRGFHLRVFCLSAFAAFLVHSLFDVPAHRWGTVACALAALAIAFPSRVHGKPSRFSSWFVFGLAGFWMLPFAFNFPQWSPTTLARVLERARVGAPQLRFSDLAALERYFPLDLYLNHLLGARLLPTQPQEAWRYFRIAERLYPNSWEWPALHAGFSQPYSPAMALHFWGKAIEKAGRRGEEVFFYAYKATEKEPLAASHWDRFVEAHPALLLSYGTLVPEAAQQCFKRWLDVRTEAPEDYETDAFYRQLPQWGMPKDLRMWMQKHPQLEKRDFRKWVRCFQQWNHFVEAWQIIARNVKCPAFPEGKISSSLLALEARYRLDPGDTFSAQSLAELLFEEGQKQRSEKLILDVASRQDAPEWFKQKAAYIFAEKGELARAVETFLASPAGD